MSVCLSVRLSVCLSVSVRDVLVHTRNRNQLQLWTGQKATVTEVTDENFKIDWNPDLAGTSLVGSGFQTGSCYLFIYLFLRVWGGFY